MNIYLLFLNKTYVSHIILKVDEAQSQQTQETTTPTPGEPATSDKDAKPTSKYSDVDQLTHVMFENIANYLKGELTGMFSFIFILVFF